MWSQYYLRHKESGDVVRMVDVPQQDPIIAEYGDGVRDAFRVKDLERVPKQPLSPSPVIPGGHRGGSAPGEIHLRTLHRQLELLEYVRDAKEPVRIQDAERDLGFRCAMLMRRQREEDRLKPLEEMGIVEHVVWGRGWYKWKITELGRTGEAELLIRSQRADGGYVDDGEGSASIGGVPVVN